MPDDLSHILSGLILAKILKIKEKKSIIMLGSVIPDLLTKPILNILLYLGYPWRIVGWLQMPFHTFLGGLLIALFLTLFFQPKRRKSIFLTFVVMLSFHLLLDSLHIYYSCGNLFLFPFSWMRTELPLFWSDYDYVFLPFLIVLFFISH